MNPMQALAIKYPTLWEHIAKGGKVKAYIPETDENISGNCSGIDVMRGWGFLIGGKYWSKEIELLPLPKRVPTKDLGKAVNWFETNIRYDQFRGSYALKNIHVSVAAIRAIVIEREECPDWWPEELKEDEEA